MITTLNFTSAPGHQVLAAVGKKILRSRGIKATEQHPSHYPGDKIEP